MKFKPYDPNDAEAVHQMLANHIDYTPEEASINCDNNADFFREMYMEERTSDINYVLEDDDNSMIYGFMGAEKRHFKSGAICWYITMLFVSKDGKEDINAVTMVESFVTAIHDAKELCVNVHPSNHDIAEFWKKNGFLPNPERSVFTNTSDQILVAYWKSIPF